MQQIDGFLRLAATDLSNHLSCPHLTTLNRAAAEGTIEPPWSHSLRLEALRERGFEHEKRYVARLREMRKSIHFVPDDVPERAFENTRRAMHAGADVIVQAALMDGRWFGRADALLKTSAPSNLGGWSYEAADAKLSRETKAGTILQLCAYSDLIAQLQGTLPEQMHVVVPGTEFQPQIYRTRDFLYYYRQIRRRLEAAIGRNDEAVTYPNPVPHCDICRWQPVCDKRRRADDHVSLVAGVSTLQQRELAARGIVTLEGLAQLPLPLPWRPDRGSPEGYERVREQARVQSTGRRNGAPIHELLARESGRGLGRLPTPSPGDIFFDIEGDPFVEPSGLEYLWGWVTEENEDSVYRCLWAFNQKEEREAYERFVDFVMDRLKRHPDLRIYHYAPYEPGALKRLMGRYTSRESEIDRMLRAGIFVDLYGVVRQSVRASVERYSIKDLEVFYDYHRRTPLREASAALHVIEFALEMENPESIKEFDKEKVRLYNADDCHSARQLRGWLEQLRTECVARGENIVRPQQASGDPPESVSAWQLKVQPVQERLLHGVSPDPNARNDEDQARWLLAHLLEWHRREQKAPWWEYFRLADLSEEELFEERAALARLEWRGRTGGTDRSPIHRYAFPDQETSIRPGDEVQMPGGDPLGKVDDIDVEQGHVDIKHRQAAADVRPTAVFAHTIVSGDEMAEALLRMAQWIVRHSINASGSYRAGRDLLLRLPPRLSGDRRLPIAEINVVRAARNLALELDHSVLAIQGPPGAGKTYTAARMALELLRSGRTVGVTAVSHKVIRNLLDAIVSGGREEGLAVRAVHKVTELSGPEHPSIRETRDNEDALSALRDGEVRVLGGTVWMWSREEFAEAVDVLFVDEAGQLSLANALAASQGARSLVLVGDPQQLEQPQQGSHPDGAGVSALEHVLGGSKTMSPDIGLFLPETWRLAPALCAFTSEQAYEGRLHPRAGLERQEIRGHTEIVGSGLWFAPVSHVGNRNASPEEIRRVVEIVRSLLNGGVEWIDSDGVAHPMKLDDILVVAPYNAQVSGLLRAAPGVRAGTVDRFQGQEAPIVIYTMATSSADEAPRGMEFLYSLNRLNVATSRARCACILVANPRLFEPDCRTPEQMRLANAFCRYLELAGVIPDRPPAGGVQP